MRFDHSLDNYVGRKEDLRFVEQQDAEDFATAQYQGYCIPHAVVPDEAGMFQVKEVMGVPTDESAVFFINSMPGEG